MSKKRIYREYLRQLRKGKGLRYSDVSDFISQPRNTYVEIEIGNRNMSAEVSTDAFEKLAELYDVSPLQLMEWELEYQRMKKDL